MRKQEWHLNKTAALSEGGVRQLIAAYRGKDGVVAKGWGFRPGFLYTQVRAISARINQNFDGWPSEELKKSYRSFLGKPVFVNHQNWDPAKARGKVVAARYVEAGDDKYVEVVQEIDASRFPKLAREIKEGGLDSVSMGVEAGFTICSYCGNRAVDVPEFCAHVKYHKGQTLPRLNPKTGKKEDVLVYEKCFKLGFFELSYVFDPADETAVVSRVIAANKIDPDEAISHAADWRTQTALPQEFVDAGIKEWERLHNKSGAAQPPPNEIVEGILPTGELPTPMMPQAALEAKINRLAYGEIEAPEDVDTLRNDDDDGTDDFKHFVESPAELRGPDLDQTKRLDRQQQQQGLDRDRRVEYVEDVEGAPMARQGAAEYDDDYGPAHSMDYAPKGVDPRYKRQPIPKRGPGDEGPGGYFRTKENIMSRRYYAAEDDGPPPPDGGPDSGKSDEELIEEAEADLQAAEDAGAGEPGSDAGGTDDDYSDSDDDEGPPPPDDSGDEGDSDLPPWLQGGGEQDSGPPPPPPSERESRRRQGNRRSSGQKRRRTRNGVPMSLAQRSRVAAAQRPRNHFADNSGHFDGGPYGEDNQGEQEEVFLSDTPSAEAVAAPTPGDSTISNTPNNLVAALQQRILSRNAQQKRDIIAYEQITGRRLANNDPGLGLGAHGTSGLGGTVYTGTGIGAEEPEGLMIHTHRRYADDNTADAMDSPAQSVSGTEVPTQADPKVNTGPGGEQVTGDDFTSVALPNVETQPNNDRSAAVYAAFDRWLQQSTGRTARQHGNPSFIRRCAARFCQSNRIPVEAMFPALGFVLREARNNEGTRRAGMRKRADESLDVAAPQDRIDVEAPVKNTTDADAQASQFDLGDFGNNAGDNLADPDLSPDSQIWAPGEGDSAANKTSNRKADGLTAVRYAEAYIRAGLAPNTSEEKWKIAGLAQTMRYATIRDRIALLDAVNQQRAASARRTAGVHRGANGSVPPGFGQRQLTAGTAREAANDIATDSAIFIK